MCVINTVCVCVCVCLMEANVETTTVSEGPELLISCFTSVPVDTNVPLKLPINTHTHAHTRTHTHALSIDSHSFNHMTRPDRLDFKQNLTSCWSSGESFFLRFD